MFSNQSPDESAQRTAAQFATTHWSTVLAAGDGASPESSAALERLCRTYWYPLYAFVRQQGKTPEEARGFVAAFLRAVPREALFERASGIEKGSASGHDANPSIGAAIRRQIPPSAHLMKTNPTLEPDGEH
jgi:hypothetical protein